VDYQRLCKHYWYGILNFYQEAYHYKGTTPKPINVMLKSFDLTTVKQAAKVHGATISEYITAQIFFAFAKERKINQSNKPITMLIPIDCRRFFPTKTL